ncbi:MAG: hypothetical protein FWC16_08250 [Defluviitaleaceae bacterium]|nr:hypothetical protein [Defluviitaleaceae bacterium]MCL2274901.1 hypothetical protein [Defluviitaleaceae bacterium]
MGVPQYKGDITQHAYDGFEKHYEYDEMLGFLRDSANFMSVRKGILRELKECLDFDVNDDEVISVLTRVVNEHGFDPDDIKGFDTEIVAWFDGSKPPSRAWATKLCFALQLNNEEAGHFLWKVCKLNGFSVRSAEEMIYCYCLANGKSYEYAKSIIAEFAKEIANNPQIQEYKQLVQECIRKKALEFTVRTDTLSRIFVDLKGLDEQTFKKRMVDHAKYFIDYSVSAYHEMVAIYEEAKKQIKKDRPVVVWLSDTVELQDKDAESGIRYATRNFSSPRKYNVVHSKGQIVEKQFDGKYEFDCALIWQHLVEVNISIGKTQTGEARPIKAISSVCNHIQMLLESLPSASRLQELTRPSRPENATKNSAARMVFVFLYFAQFAIRWERYLFDVEEEGEAPEEFFSEFYEGLNELLENCGYGYLYYPNPFDWHILTCVRLLDEGTKSDDELGALEWFNKAMTEMAGDSDE